jgi:hypothetical protein
MLKMCGLRWAIFFGVEVTDVAVAGVGGKDRQRRCVWEKSLVEKRISPLRCASVEMMILVGMVAEAGRKFSGIRSR